MKAAELIPGVFILIAITAATTHAQQQFTQTVTRENISCNATCSVLDVPELNNNLAAIIFVTPAEGTKNLNPHPIGAYFMYQKKWSIYNVDGVAITDGAKYNVQYYPNPDIDRFVFTVSQRGDACIDHAGLNGAPDATVRMFPTSPATRGSLFNHDETKVEYNAAANKWCIANINGNAVTSDSAYNVMFSGGEPVVTNTNSGKTINPNTKTPGSILPNEKAGGDLNGNYPNPAVIGLQGKPVSTNPPMIGQVLKWNGTAWEPSTETPSTTATTTVEPMQTFLKDHTGPMISVNGNAFFVFPDLTHVITLTKRSRVIITAFANIKGSFCAVIDCGGSGGSLGIQINGTGWAG